MEHVTVEQMTSEWHPVDVRLSSDAGSVAWVAERYGKDGEHPESDIWVGPIDGTRPGRRWTWGGEDREPRWSPDGRQLAFLSDRAERGTAGLYVMDVDGGEARPLVVRKRAVAGFAWSPDGGRIAFLAPDDPTDEDERRERERDDADVYGEGWRYQRLRVVEVTTGETTGPLTGDVHVTEVVWSPDGEWLGCVVRSSPELDTRFDAQVVVLRPDGHDLRTVYRGDPGGSAGRPRTGSCSPRGTTRDSSPRVPRCGPRRRRVVIYASLAPHGKSLAARSASIAHRCPPRSPSWSPMVSRRASSCGIPPVATAGASFTRHGVPWGPATRRVSGWQ